jgi:type II secretory pathway component PulM
MLSSLLAKFEPSLEIMRAFYASRESREKRALLVLAGVLACVFFYGLLLAPLNHHLQTVRADIKHDETTLAWMQSADKVLSSPNATHVHPMTPVEALAALQTAIQASSFSVTLKGLKQSGDHSISLQLEAVPFDQLMVFLGEFESRDALTMREFTASSAGATPGLVNVNLIFDVP